MNKTNEQLGTAPLKRLMLELAIPNVLAQVVNLLYNMVDRVFVGHIPEEGSLALSGLGVAFPVIMLISAFAYLVGMGGAPRAAICLGQGDRDGAEKILGASAAFLLILSVVLSAVFQVVKHPLLLFFGASGDTIGYADQYLQIYLTGTISVQAALGLNPFITCQGFAKTGMVTVLIGAVMNMVLDPILIFGFHLGVRGAAVATVISQTVSGLWVLLFLCRERSVLRIRRAYLKLDPAVLRPVLLLGISPFIMNATECLVQLTFNTGMQTYGNDDYVGAMTIIFSLSQMLFLPVQGISQGATPIISYNYGARNLDRVMEAFKLLLKCTLLFNFVGAALFIAFPRVFIGLFTPDPEIVRIASHGLRIYNIGFLIFGAQSACQQTFLALGEAKISMFLALLRKAILLIPLAIILPRLGLGTDGLFIAEPISDILAVCTTVTMFHLNIGKILNRNSG